MDKKLKFKYMKDNTFFTVVIVFLVIMKVSIVASIIWMSIEFMLYLFKDTQFNFTSLYTFIGLVSFALILLIMGVVMNIKEKKVRKSELESRLEKLIKERDKIM